MKITYTELQNLDFIEDATETLRPCWGNGSVLGGFSIGKFESPVSGGGGDMGLFLSGGKAGGGSRSFKLMYERNVSPQNKDNLGYDYTVRYLHRY